MVNPPMLPASEAVRLILCLAEQVDALHRGGQLHRAIVAAEIRYGDPASGPRLPVPPAGLVSVGGPAADGDASPPELWRAGPIAVPARIDAARRVLAAAGHDVDPVRIDLFQLGTALVRLLTGQSADVYLRSPRSAARVPALLRSLIDRALGGETDKGFRSVAQFAEAAKAILSEMESSFEAGTAPPQADGATAAEQDTTPSFLTAPGDADTQIEGGLDSVAADGLPFARLGHYEVLERIGHGGMGDVYRAHEPRLNRTVAVKVLPLHLARNEEFVRRFHAEATAAARVVHPNVVQILSIGEDQGHHFYVMQFVDGESLANLLHRRNRVSVSESLNLIEQILAGLWAAHAQGLIHRDIKPANVLLDRSGRALLADFGLVKSLAADGGLTATGVILGTADYISPEQGRGRPVDARSDLYSVGVLMYRMLSGSLPFQARGPTAMIFQHAYEPPRPLQRIAPGVPTELAGIVDRLLAKSPDERYRSAEDLLLTLRALRAGTDEEPLRSAPGSCSDGHPTRVIPAPNFDDLPAVPSECSLERPAQGRFWRRAFRLFRRLAPELVRELQTTQQHVDGIIRDYEARRNQLAAMLAEAESAMRELNALAAQHTDEDSRRGPASAAAEQHEQLATVRIQLARLDAALQQLRGRRDLLNARLQVAQARLRVAGVGIPRAPVRSFLGRVGWRRWTKLAVAAALWLTVVILYRDLWRARSAKESPGSGRTAAASLTRAPQRSAVASSAGLRIDERSMERRIALSPDGRFAVGCTYSAEPVAGGGSAIEAKLWDLRSGMEVLRLEGAHRSRGMAISPDGTRLASAGLAAENGSPEIRLWDLTTGQVTLRVEAVLPREAFVPLAFSRDGATVYALLGTFLTHTIGILDADTGELQRIPMPLSEDQATAAAFSPIEDTAAVGIVVTRPDGRCAIDVHDLALGKMRFSFRPGRTTRALAYSGDGSILAGSIFGTILAWKTDDWRTVAELPAARSFHDKLAISHDGRYLAALHSRTLEVWDLTSQTRRELVASGCLDMTFTPGGTLVAAPANAQFRFFDPASGKELLLPALGPP